LEKSLGSWKVKNLKVILPGVIQFGIEKNVEGVIEA
jgi:hypothetical protein